MLHLYKASSANLCKLQTGYMRLFSKKAISYHGDIQTEQTISFSLENNFTISP